jgi:hypothetical protein
MDDQNKTEGQRLVDRKELLDAQLCISEHVTRQARRLLYCETPQELLNALRDLANCVTHESRSVRSKFL